MPFPAGRKREREAREISYQNALAQSILTSRSFTTAIISIVSNTQMISKFRFSESFNEKHPLGGDYLSRIEKKNVSSEMVRLKMVGREKNCNG